MTDKKCEELIDQRLRDRLAQHLPDWDDEVVVDDIRTELDCDPDMDKWLVQSDYRDRLLEGVLSVEKYTTYKALLSTGGPADWFEFVFDSEGDLGQCWYVYQDWYDGARRRVDPGQAEQLADLFCVGPQFE